MPTSLSIVIPAKNEAMSLKLLLPELLSLYPEAEVIVVNDGSDDDTQPISEQAGARVICHPYSMGNGAAIKSGARAARGEVIVFMDADGQHRPNDIAPLLSRMQDGYDMVVGTRSRKMQASSARLVANSLYNALASYMSGRPIGDLTSGFRAVNAKKFRQYLYLLPNGFSYPTTVTMAFLRSGYLVDFVPVEVEQRIGKSHINLVRDGFRFFIIIFKIGTLYSPLKLFLPISMAFFLVATSYYGYTLITMGRFTNMSALLYVTSVLVFLIGLISEQITTLVYLRESDES